MEHNVLVKKLAELMKERGFNQKSLALQAGLHETAVRDILKGRSKNPEIGTLSALADSLGVGLDELAGKPAPGSSRGAVARIIEMDVRARATGDSALSEEEVVAQWEFPFSLIQAQTTAPVTALRIIAVYGDSMDPTFPPGTKVLVDTSDCRPTPPGVFVLWDGLGLVIRRIELIPRSEPPRLRISSDNERYRPYEDSLFDTEIRGRVIGRWLWT